MLLAKLMVTVYPHDQFLAMYKQPYQASPNSHFLLLPLEFNFLALVLISTIVFCIVLKFFLALDFGVSALVALSWN